MNVMVVADGHYYEAPNGVIYVESVFNYEFYKRYLEVFNKVYVVARIAKVDKIPQNKEVASGKNVEFLKLPAYKGPMQYLYNYFKIKKLSIRYSNIVDCAIFRIPGATANILCKSYKKTNKPYAVEVVVDPWEYFAKGTVKSKVRPIVRCVWTHFIRKTCKSANGVSYVTEEYLQNRYPCKAITHKESKSYFTEHYSSVELKESTYGSPKKYKDKDEFIISHVANAFTGYGKGHLILMKALKCVRDKGYNVKAIFIGDGPLKDEFINYSKKINVDKYVDFVGKLPDGDEVRKVINKSDLFVFPTRAEGLPRVLLEAMSMGLPCVSSPTCGIPEILSNDFLCDYNNYNDFAEKIIRFITDKDLMERESLNNLQISKRYSNVELNKRRINFYSTLLTLAEEGK